MIGAMNLTAPSDPRAWPSLSHQLALAERLYGEDGAGRIENWLRTQIDRIGNAEFARLFSDHIDLPGIASLDYAHRYVRTGVGSLIGGIRFYGHDIERPFVEVIAHDFGPGSGDDATLDAETLSALARVVASEWSAFRPLHLRFRVPPGVALLPNARVDTHVFVSRYGDMAPPDGRVRLVPFKDVHGLSAADVAMGMVGERFGAMERDEPVLRRNVSPIEPDYLRELHEAGRLHAIMPSGAAAPVGLLAVAPGGVDWIEGDEVMEEIVGQKYAGHGYAASAQATFAARPETPPDELLIGTIDALNVASRRTAERAGRANVMDYLFMKLANVA